MADVIEPRTLGEAKLDARYGSLFHGLNARFFKRLQLLFAIISLVSGTAAFSLVFREDPTIGAIAGGILAILTIINQVVSPASRAIEHEAMAKRYGELVANTSLSTVAAFDAELEKLRSGDHSGLSVFERCAYNANVTAAGYESWRMPLTAWQRFVSLMV
jgi:hypothetical protein